jgi:predicted pyridoxine 5'-phosphate oxidase superfamily flavin-nucleotide-binding protein
VVTIGRIFDHFGEAEAAFIAARDSFYMATVSETGWPYIQHRGGPPGFLKVFDEKTLGFADFRGNRQYISIGNASADDRCALFLMDYPNRQRLKVFARTEIVDLKTNETVAMRLALPGYKAKIERGILFHLEAYDWNCSQHITPRFSESELADALEPIRDRIRDLEAENRQLKARLGEAGGAP